MEHGIRVIGHLAPLVTHLRAPRGSNGLVVGFTVVLREQGCLLVFQRFHESFTSIGFVAKPACPAVDLFVGPLTEVRTEPLLHESTHLGAHVLVHINGDFVLVNVLLEVFVEGDI